MKVNLKGLAYALEGTSRYKSVTATATGIECEQGPITWRIDATGAINVAVNGYVDAAYIANGYEWLYDTLGCFVLPLK